MLCPKFKDIKHSEWLFMYESRANCHNSDFTAILHDI